jgi:hypothetical protein
MLISKFEEIKMLEEETFGEIYSKISDLRNSMVNLGKPISDVKLIQKILRDQGMTTTASVHVSVTILYLALSSE